MTSQILLDLANKEEENLQLRRFPMQADYTNRASFIRGMETILEQLSEDSLDAVLEKAVEKKLLTHNKLEQWTRKALIKEAWEIINKFKEQECKAKT